MVGVVVVIHDEVATVRQPFGIVHGREHEDVGGVVAVRPGVAPAVEEVAAMAGTPARAARRLLRRGRVIDHPQLAVVVGGDDDLVEVLDVVGRVEVHDVFGDVQALAVVDVDSLRVVRHHPVVGLGGIEVLDEVVGAPPLPDDLAGGAALRSDLNDGIEPQAAGGETVGIAAEGDRVVLRVVSPDRHQEVAVGHHGHYVMGGIVIAVVLVRPEHLTVLRDPLDDPADVEDRVVPFAVGRNEAIVGRQVVDRPAAEDAAVRQQEGGLPGLVGAGPFVD